MTTYAMTDQNRVNALLQALFTSSTTFTVTPGTGGGSAFTVTPPYHLRLMTTTGSNTANGTEATSSNCPGYTAGSVTSNSMGSSAFGAPASGSQANGNVVSWAATGTWTSVAGIEIWDAAGTPLRWLQGPLATAVSGVVNGDTVQFAAGGSVSVNAAAW